MKRASASVCMLLLVFLVAQGAGTEQSSLPLNRGWSLNTSGIVFESWPLQEAQQSVSFTFPDSSSKTYVDYLITKIHRGISGTITAQIQMVAPLTATFIANPDPNSCLTTPAQVRLYFDSGNNDGQRWWSNPVSVILVNGTFTMSVPLTPNQWSGLNGEWANQDATTIANFNLAMLKANLTGMTFGSCFFGHGVNVSGGPAYFNLTSYVIQ